MKSDVLVVALLWLPVAWPAAIRNEDDPCRSYTFNNLIYLDCSERELTEFPETATLNNGAQVLVLANNNFETFPKQLEQFDRAVKIDMSGNRLSRPLPSFLVNMPHLQSLNLSDNNYDNWTSDRRNSNLQYLDLSKNKISQIHDEAFQGMTGLRYLDLSENRINYLQPKIFSGATDLLSLTLSRNSFTKVPSFQLTSLRSLHLSNCQIDNLSVDSLTGMTSLLEIDLSINQIESVPDNFRSHSLQELDLSYNEISALTDRTFSALPNLAVLDLRGNGFKDVWSSSSFASNPYLREVHVKGNRWSCDGFGVNLLLSYEFLTREPAKVIDPSSSLICYSPSNVTQMTWQRAYIETWHRDETTADSNNIYMALMIGVIVGALMMSLICRIVMSFNEPILPRQPVTETLNGHGMTPQPRVESLVVRVPLHNEDLPPTYDEALLMPRLNASFHSLPDFEDEVEEPIERRHRRSRSIGDLTEVRPRMSDRRSVQVLVLANNNFETFPKQLEQFDRAVKIDMSGNRLSRPLPSFLANMPNLQSLNLSDNNYDNWISDLRNSNLQYLDLSKNKISQIHDEAFQGMTGLHYLDLSENRINDLQPKIFSGATDLLSLTLSRNSFTKVPSFQSTSLRSLHLSNCQIDNLSVDSLTGMTSLLEIDLSINQIESVPDNFRSHSLQELDLSYNEISTITDRTFSALPNLAVLDLRGNGFKDVWSSAYFASNPYLREVHVKGNRWSCDGFGVNLLLSYEFLTREPAKVIDPSSSLICYSPSNVTQMTWQRAYIETWHRDETTAESYMFMAVMIGVIIGVLMTSLICRMLMSINKPEPPRPPATETAALNGHGMTPQPRVESLIMRVPLHDEDLPPTYDEALLMPRLNASFHSLPDFVDEVEEPMERRYRRSRSIGDLTEVRPRMSDRRSVRPQTAIEIRIH